jgi:hypothetical protein
MYQFGAGYNERRQIMSANTTSRLYDTFNGIRINIVQVMCSNCYISLVGRHARTSVTSVAQTGQILIPDAVTCVLNLVTGIGLLGVASVVRTARVFSGIFSICPLFTSN